MRFSTVLRISLAHSGTGTKRAGFFSSAMVRGLVCRSLNLTMLREWLTRVVVRKITGVLNCSESSMPSFTKSRASWLSAGSRMGILANLA